MIASQFDPRDNILDRLILGWVHHPMGPLILERCVERLRTSAVPAHSRVPH